MTTITNGQSQGRAGSVSRLTPSLATKIEKAILDHAGSISPKVRDLASLAAQTERALIAELDSKWNEYETVRQTIARIDSLLLGEEEMADQQPEARATINIRNCLIDQLDFSHCFQMDEIEADIAPFEIYMKINEYRQYTKNLYMLMDEATNEQQYQAVLGALMQLCPGNFTFINELLIRNLCTRNIRPALYRFNLAKIQADSRMHQSVCHDK